MGALNAALDAFEADAQISVIVVTGSAKAFAAGADIKEMQAKTYPETLVADFIADWQRLPASASRRSPLWRALPSAAAARSL